MGGKAGGAGCGGVVGRGDREDDGRRLIGGGGVEVEVEVVEAFVGNWDGETDVGGS